MGLITVLDLETTGLDWNKGDRIFEIAAALYDERTHRLIGSFVQRCNPMRAVSARAAQITGVTLADLEGEPAYSEVAPKIDMILAQTSLLVGHNLAGFDDPFLRHEQARFGFRRAPKAIFDTMLNARFATFDGKLPTLQELCFALGVVYDPEQAHAALYDVECTAKAFFEGIRFGVFRPIID